MVCHNNGVSSEIDVSEGSLVWVRRQNGSWWPGRIIGLDELPASYKQPPRKRTPIKLLGREGGSVDWYNLQKSNRIKAFHCGEYDEWIEKAKISASVSRKKPTNSGKYVYREDAILHALELEKAHASNGNEKFRSTKKNLMVTTGSYLSQQSQSVFGHSKKRGFMSRKPIIFEENAIQEGSAISFERQDNLAAADTQFIRRKRRKTPNDSEDNAEGVKRMRGLQDLGLRMVPKPQPSECFASVGSHELDPTDSASLDDSLAGGFYSVSPTSSCKESCSSLKQKRSRTVQVYGNSKRKNRLRPLIGLSMGAVKVKDPSHCRRGAFSEESYPWGVSKNKLRASRSCSNKTKFPLGTNNSPDCSDTLYNETLLHAGENAYGSEVDDTQLDYEILDSELPSMFDDCSDGFVNVPVMEENVAEGFSLPLRSAPRKLHSASRVNHVRGNSSCLGLSMNADSETFVGQTCGSVSQVLREVPVAHVELLGQDFASEYGHFLSTKLFNSNRYPRSPPTSFPTYSGYPDLDPDRGMYMDSPLYDVELNVERSYQGPKAPLVSLVSTWNGKAITGPRIEVGVVKSGLVDALVISNGCCPLTSDAEMRLSCKKRRQFSRRKIRRLSLITAVDRIGKEREREAVAMKVGGPPNSCVSLGLVFSRLNQALSIRSVRLAS